jgi:hypothetical protein
MYFSYYNIYYFSILKSENELFLLIIKKLPLELILIIILIIFLAKSLYTLLIIKCFQML